MDQVEAKNNYGIDKQNPKEKRFKENMTLSTCSPSAVFALQSPMSDPRLVTMIMDRLIPHECLLSYIRY